MRRPKADPADISRKIADVATDTLASDITLLNISELTSFADIFVICSADNIRQLNALREAIVLELRDEGIQPIRVEGVADGGWVLIDYGDVVVQLLTPDQREFYRLEDLWLEAPVLLKIQ